MTIITNAFSLQMITNFPSSIKMTEITQADFDAVKDTAVSAVGHADTANVLGVQMNRINVVLDNDTEIIVAQITGGRLPEGSTTLPEGFAFKFIKVTLG